MAGGVTLNVRQIGSYPLATAANAGDMLLMQAGGLGSPYASVDAQTLVQTALSEGSLGVGEQVPANADFGNVFAGYYAVPLDSGIFWNSYASTPSGASAYWQNGVAAQLRFDTPYGWTWTLGPAGNAGATAPPAFSDLMILTVAGGLQLPLGTLTVARDPGSALEVATMGWVGNNTVASFNGRRGVVTLSSADIYAALCLDSCIATENWVNAQIQASITMLLANHPFVFGWNGRTGAVYLTLADISCVFFQPGQQPITQTPPLTSNDYSIPNTAWVVEYIQTEFAGSGATLATQAWVLANTVNSFNGRMGPVTLTTSDVIDVGAAPLNSPAFSGIPTAPTANPGQATGQIATTAFVQQAITNNTAGVSTFNTRTGDVVLETADITAAGGLVNPSANLTGAPSCPTAPPGTSTPQIANTQFVMAAIAAGTVTSFNTRTGAVTLTLADVTGVGGAPLVSPAFSSVPTAPTAAPGTNTVQLATTAFVNAAVTAAGGVSSFNSRTGAVTLTANDVSAAGALVNPSVGLTGQPTATTATAGDNTTRIATTAFVQQALSSGAVTSFNTRTGAITLQGADITSAGGALLAGPAFTGVPTAPTAVTGTNNTQIATTAFVNAEIAADTSGVTSFNTRTGAVTLTLADITGAGGAPLASPSFTGVPLGPTATAGTSTTQLATTAFVQAAIASSGVASFNGRTGAVTLIANDVSAAGGALIASPTFTGVPAGPTAAPGTSTTQLATTAFVAAATGGFLPLAGGALTGALTSNSNITTTSNVIGATGFFTTLGGNPGGTAVNVGAPMVVTGTNAFTVSGGPVNLGAGLNVGTSMAVNTTGAANGQLALLEQGNTARQWVLIANTGFLNISSSNVSNAIRYDGINNNFQINGPTAYKPGGGAWSDSSDARIKDIVGPYEAGLAAVCALQPKQFYFKGNDASEDGHSPHATAKGRLFTGLIADEVMAVFPECVEMRRGWIDGKEVTDLKTLDTGPLLYALINAVKELAAQVKALTP